MCLNLNLKIKDHTHSITNYTTHTHYTLQTNLGVQFRITCNPETMNMVNVAMVMKAFPILKGMGAQEVIDALYPGVEVRPPEGTKGRRDEGTKGRGTIKHTIFDQETN